MVEKAAIIKIGITNIKVWSLLINIFSIAGSKSQAVAEVLPATKIENPPIIHPAILITENKSCNPCFIKLTSFIEKLSSSIGRALLIDRIIPLSSVLSSSLLTSSIALTIIKGSLCLSFKNRFAKI